MEAGGGGQLVRRHNAVRLSQILVPDVLAVGRVRAAERIVLTLHKLVRRLMSGCRECRLAVIWGQFTLIKRFTVGHRPTQIHIPMLTIGGQMVMGVRLMCQQRLLPRRSRREGVLMQLEPRIILVRQHFTAGGRPVRFVMNR
jgi:hypothetical protein